MGDIARDNNWPAQREPRADGVFGQLPANLIHRAVQVDFDYFTAEVGPVYLGQIFSRFGFELFQKDALGRDLGEYLAIGRAGYRQADWTGRPVAR